MLLHNFDTATFLLSDSFLEQCLLSLVSCNSAAFLHHSSVRIMLSRTANPAATPPSFDEETFVRIK